jgi:hypothetical protein
MAPTLSIITLTIPERVKSLALLKAEVAKQNPDGLVEHVIVEGPGHVGTKIAKGLRMSSGRYVSVVDDDDMIDVDYVSSILAETVHNPDVITLGICTPGLPPCWQRANRNDDSCFENPGADGNVRMANHLCAWKREIALVAPCLPRNYGWDRVWYNSIRIAYPKLTERHIHKVLYLYLYSEEGTRAQSRESIADSQDNNGSRIKIWRLKDGSIVAGRFTNQLWGADGEARDYHNTELEFLEEIVFG